MKQRTQKYLHAILALVLSLCLITGCSLFPNSASQTAKNTIQETTAEALTENPSDASFSQPDEATLAAAQEAFDQYTENLFKQEAAQSFLTLHYTLADPESYGITDYDRTLGTVSAEDIRKDMEEVKQIRSDLDNMDSRLLSKDQLLTYTILSSYINTLLSSDGFPFFCQNIHFTVNRTLTITCPFCPPLTPIMTLLSPLKTNALTQILVCVIWSLTISSAPAMLILLMQITALWQKHLLPA